MQQYTSNIISTNWCKLPLWAAVVVVALNGAKWLLKTDVIEPSEWCTGDVLDCVVGHQEVFLAYHTTQLY